MIVIIAVLIIHVNRIILHDIFIFLIMLTSMHHDVVIINAAQLHSTVSELRFCHVQTLLVMCQRFAMVSISDNGFRWK